MKLLATLAAATAALAATSASATDFSFAGTLPSQDSILLFDFTVGTQSTVTLVSYSYAGGTQANGNVASRGGFDPYLSLYDAAGDYLGRDDDGSTVVDPDTGSSYDVRFSQSLAAGNYTVALTAYNLAGNGSRLDRSNPSTAFSGTPNLNGRTTNFAFDVLGADASTGPGAGVVPEPATWAMMLVGFAATGAAMRRRRVAHRAVTA